VKRIAAEAVAMGVELSAEQAQLLLRYEALLRERAIPLGIVARSDRDRLHQRHVVDSLRAATLFRSADRMAYDLGSGAGLPGIPLAIALPGCRFTLAESRSKRAAFLELVVAELALTNADVHADRVETLSSGADVVTARAFAPLGETWRLAAQLLRPKGRLIYFAGEGMRDPERTARDLPGPPRQVAVEKVLESSAPLVMMALE
jgi:16S rRNA (guanine527-N7)-methyltransferase